MVNMIDVYFIMKKMGEEVGGISLEEKDPSTGLKIWRAYKVYPITERTVLFQRNKHEFAVMDGEYKHEMGTIRIQYMNNREYMNINVR